MIKASVYRFWRKPKAQCNWCPRIEVAYGINGEVLVIVENNQGAIMHELRKMGIDYSSVLEPFGEVEVTVSEFKSLKNRLTG